MGMIVRPPASPRHTLDNILETSYYTLNHIKPSFYMQAHQTSARYPDGVSEFEAVGLTPVYSPQIQAPYVAEASVRIGLELAETHELPINGTVLVIGHIREVFVEETCLLPDGYIDLEMAETITVSSLDSYHSTQRLGRLRYAKPDKSPQLL
jgi:flavin reductase (DIM6/NTAB) family NADH-FMN oxidoreductase RutF